MELTVTIIIFRGPDDVEIDPMRSLTAFDEYSLNGMRSCREGWDLYNLAHDMGLRDEVFCSWLNQAVDSNGVNMATHVRMGHFAYVTLEMQQQWQVQKYVAA